MDFERSAGDGRRASWLLAGELDLFSAADLAATLRTEAEAEHDVVLDLSKVTLFDSTALGVLLAATKRASSRGLVVALRTNASPPVMQMVDAAGTRERLATLQGYLSSGASSPSSGGR
jgi:anti-anti-sigma factor